MYKCFKLTNKYRITFNSFPKTAKSISNVYLTGIRNWITQDSINYSIVINIFRVIFSIERPVNECNNQ